MDRKTELKNCFPASNIINLKLNDVSVLPEELKNSKPATICQRYYTNTRLFGEKNSFYSIAEFFVRVTTLSEQKVSLREEKSNNKSRRIGIK